MRSDRHVQLEYMIDYCANYSERLNDWERGFIEALSDKLERFGDLTEKQAKKLEQIYYRLP